MIFLYFLFHVSSNSDSLLIAIEPRIKCMIHTAAMLLYIIRKITVTNLHTFPSYITMSF